MGTLGCNHIHDLCARNQIYPGFKHTALELHSMPSNKIHQTLELYPGSGVGRNSSREVRFQWDFTKRS